MKLSVVMPVYNEVNTFLEIFRQVKEYPMEKEIIIVDDFSTDGTREILEKVNDDNVQILFNEKNYGKGFCVRRGFDLAKGDIVIIQDTDLEYYPSEYSILIKRILEGKADVVYGTRFLGEHRVFFFSHFLGNFILNNIANILYNTNLTDLMTGYKVFTRDAIDKLNLHANGFGVEAEITAQVFKHNLRVYEVPISYNGRNYDEGKKITWKDFFRSLYWLFRCRFASYDIGKDTLSRMRVMKNNNRWLFNQIKPYIGDRVLEIGSGIGNISALLSSLKKKLILTEINEHYVDYLRQRFIGNPSIEVFRKDVTSNDFLDLRNFNTDTAVCINVLEHIKDDNKALENIYHTIELDGKLILVVPALKPLYGSIDKGLDHFRRYSRTDLKDKLESKGFIVEEMFYHNFLSAIGWFVNGRILKKKIISSVQVKILDLFIPIIAAIERRIKVPLGLSLIVVCRKK